MVTRITKIVIGVIGVIAVITPSFAQTSDVKDIQTAKVKLQIGTNSSKYFSEILETISAAATHHQSPTAKAVYDYVSSLSGGHTIRDDGSDMTQRAALNFTSTATITAAATDDSGNDETEIALSLAQQSATSGQVLKWNGSAWAPDDDDPGITSGSTAAGDLDGTYPSPTVDGLQNRPVAATAPATGEVLKWNGTAWEPAIDSNGIYSGSNNVPDGTVATLEGSLEISGGDLSNVTITTGTSTGGQIFSNLAGASLIRRDTTGNTSLELTGTGASFNFNDGSTDRLTINDRDARYGGEYDLDSRLSIPYRGYVDDALIGAGGIYSGSGTVYHNAVATVDSSYEFFLGRFPGAPNVLGNSDKFIRYGLAIDNVGFGTGKATFIFGVANDRSTRGYVRAYTSGAYIGASSSSGIESEYSLLLGKESSIIYQGGTIGKYRSLRRFATASGDTSNYLSWYQGGNKGGTFTDTAALAVWMGIPTYTGNMGAAGANWAYSTDRGFGFQALFGSLGGTGVTHFDYFKVRAGQADTTSNSFWFYGKYPVVNASPGAGNRIQEWVDGVPHWIDTPSGGGGVTDHGALTGLTDDDHTQYALLAGRSGGQVLTGGTGSGDDLTLRSTTNATKGDIIAADQGGNVIVGGAATASEIQFMEPSGSGTNYTGLKAAASDASTTYTLPATPPTANGQVLASTTGGVTSWATKTTVVYAYTTAQTNTSLAVPSGAVSAEIVVTGGGGGGGAGRRGAAGTIRSGGGGGSGAGCSIISFQVSDFGTSTLYVTVGSGGVGGPAQTSNDTNGSNGGSGGASYVSTSTSSSDAIIRAIGGASGIGGDANGSAGGSATTSGSVIPGGNGGASSATGGNGTGAASIQGATGGGAGGGITTGNVGGNGGSNGASYLGIYSSVSGASAGASGTDGATPGARPIGQSGTGGGGNASGGGGTGGAGTRGGGGGGGGASLNGNNSGAGGAGGDGYVRVTFFF